MVAATPSRRTQHHAVATLALAALLVMHGVAHFAGMTDKFDKADVGDAAQYLGEVWTISDPSVLRALGVMWAIVGTAVIVSSVTVWRRRANAREIVAAATLVSLTLSIVGLWAAIIGVVINTALLALVALAPDRAGLR